MCNTDDKTQWIPLFWTAKVIVVQTVYQAAASSLVQSFWKWTQRREREHFKGPVMLSDSFLPAFSEGDMCCQPVSQPKPGNEKSRSHGVIFIVWKCVLKQTVLIPLWCHLSDLTHTSLRSVTKPSQVLVPPHYHFVLVYYQICGRSQQSISSSRKPELKLDLGSAWVLSIKQVLFGWVYS